MIQIENLSGKPYDKIYLKETDSTYSDIQNHIMKNIKRPYPESPKHVDNSKKYTMYVKTSIKLFNKGKLINFYDDISFDKEDSVLQIYIKYEYLCYLCFNDTIIFNENNILNKIINLIKDDGRFINLLSDKEQTEELCKLAVQQNGLSLQYVKIQQTEELCKLAVQQDGRALAFVKIGQSEELCKLAIQQNGYALSLVKKQTEELCKLAVQQNGYSLQYVKEQTEELCKLAVQEERYALKYVPEHMKHLFI